MAELVDALVSNTNGSNTVPVRSRLRVQKRAAIFAALFFVFLCAVFRQFAEVLKGLCGFLRVLRALRGEDDVCFRRLSEAFGAFEGALRALRGEDDVCFRRLSELLKNHFGSLDKPWGLGINFRRQYKNECPCVVGEDLVVVFREKHLSGLDLLIMAE